MYRPRSLFLLPLCVLPTLADHIGPRYPWPTDLTSDKSTIPKAWKEATSTLQGYLDTNKSFEGVTGLDTIAFSIGLFSLTDPSVSDLQFHHTSPEVAKAVNGTNEVDGDTIYQVASITKLFTVLTGLLEFNSTDWDLTVADVFPQILDLARKASGDNEVNTLAWDQITLKTLASQISGLPTNPLLTDTLVTYLFSLLVGIKTADPVTLGYPPYNPKDPYENVASVELTNTSVFLPQIANKYPNFLPWQSPLYSNNNFILLTALFEKITGKALSEATTKDIIEPLGMTNTYSGLVAQSALNNSVVLDPSFNAPPGLAVGSGGIASTVNDLALFGSAILNYTLLSPFATREWMKPVSHTSRLEFSFGRPWEIIRYTHPSGAVTDLYTKAGDSGTSSSYLVLIPDYNAGFTILAGGTNPSRNDLVGRIGDVIYRSILPALETQAAREAEKNFAGKYKAKNLNSTLTLSLPAAADPKAAPGLLIDSFISNSSNVQDTVSFYFTPGARLMPSIADAEDGLMAYRVSTVGDSPKVDISGNLFSGTGIGDYLIGDAGSYGGVGVTLFVFEVEDGRARAVEAPAWRVVMERCQS